MQLLMTIIIVVTSFIVSLFLLKMYLVIRREKMREKRNTEALRLMIKRSKKTVDNLTEVNYNNITAHQYDYDTLPATLSTSIAVDIITDNLD